MKDIMKCTIKELACPGIIGLVTESNGIQVLYSKNVSKLMCRIIEQLGNNNYRNREIQNSYNEDTLQYVLFEKINFGSMASTSHNLVMRYKANELRNKMLSEGYSVISFYNALQLKFSVRVVAYHGPQVIINTARYRKLYVQLEFKTVQEANQYVVNTDLWKALLDTQGIDIPYKAGT